MMNGAEFRPHHFLWEMRGSIAVVSLNRPEKKNPLTFDSYAELRDTFRALGKTSAVKALILTGAGGNFCSGGDVFEIIGPLTKMKPKGHLAFARMTGDVVKAMLNARMPVIAAVDGVCMGAGAILAMASDIRLATPVAKTAFLFNKVGLAGCDMGACAMLPRIVGFGRAAELLFLGRTMSAEEGERWGFYNRIVSPDQLMAAAQMIARTIAEGPALATAVTKRQLHREWDMALEKAIDTEAREQARLMGSRDFKRAFEAFKTKTKPVFKGD
ncbi:MAG TPA: enoyl-CoA hydratase family protein [Sphingomonadales bacterium]|nr:enoyl-CoA hydratase family protein [Sphingomonadales bacterium]